MMSFDEEKIEEVVVKLTELLQYFKGNNRISINKLIRCKPYMTKGGSPPVERNYKIEHDRTIEVIVDKPKVAKITATKGSSFGSSGWFLTAKFDVPDIKPYGLGIIFSSYKSAKTHWEQYERGEKDTNHWEFEEIRRSRKVKCNECEKTIINLTAKQCSECGRYFCDDCLGDDVCTDCGWKDD